MTQLDDHIGRVEEYGLKRDVFPLQYGGHVISILCNDAYIANDGRLLFDFSLYCMECEQESSLSGRFPASCDEQVEYVCNARVAIFAPFKTTICE